MAKIEQSGVPTCLCGGGPQCRNPLARATWGDRLSLVAPSGNVAGLSPALEFARVLLPRGAMNAQWRITLQVPPQTTPANVDFAIKIRVGSRFSGDIPSTVASGAAAQIDIPGATGIVVAARTGALGVDCTAVVFVVPLNWYWLAPCLQRDADYPKRVEGEGDLLTAGYLG
jgi:hypothetical protein